MSSLKSTLCLCVTLCLFIVIVDPHLLHDPELNDVWRDFKKLHNKFFSDADTEAKRRHIFEEALEFIKEHNIQADLGQETFRMGLTQFADWTLDEFKAYLNAKILGPNSTYTGNDPQVKMVTSSSLPASVNWVTEGAVTPVKNQGNCGCCYSFSATGALEGQLFLQTGQLVSLSEQNILDCSGSEGNQGCNGGAIQYAFQYVDDNGGIDTEASYPYTGKQGTCSYNSYNSGATCSGFTNLPSGDEGALQQAVANIGPISAAIDASTLQYYRSGVYSSSRCSSTNLDHAVLVVGYGTSSSGQAYWLVKNSWGTHWGMNGYFELARNANNMCGIASGNVYPSL